MINYNIALSSFLFISRTYNLKINIVIFKSVSLIFIHNQSRLIKHKREKEFFYKNIRILI
jgi:hypothetical protein